MDNIVISALDTTVEEQRESFINNINRMSDKQYRTNIVTLGIFNSNRQSFLDVLQGTEDRFLDICSEMGCSSSFINNWRERSNSGRNCRYYPTFFTFYWEEDTTPILMPVLLQVYFRATNKCSALDQVMLDLEAHREGLFQLVYLNNIFVRVLLPKFGLSTLDSARSRDINTCIQSDY